MIPTPKTETLNKDQNSPFSVFSSNKNVNKNTNIFSFNNQNNTPFVHLQKSNTSLPINTFNTPIFSNLPQNNILSNNLNNTIKVVSCSDSLNELNSNDTSQNKNKIGLGKQTLNVNIKQQNLQQKKMSKSDIFNTSSISANTQNAINPGNTIVGPNLFTKPTPNNNISCPPVTLINSKNNMFQNKSTQSFEKSVNEIKSDEQKQLHNEIIKLKQENKKLLDQLGLKEQRLKYLQQQNKQIKKQNNSIINTHQLIQKQLQKKLKQLQDQYSKLNKSKDIINQVFSQTNNSILNNIYQKTTKFCSLHSKFSSLFQEKQIQKLNALIQQQISRVLKRTQQLFDSSLQILINVIEQISKNHEITIQDLKSTKIQIKSVLTRHNQQKLTKIQQSLIKNTLFPIDEQIIQFQGKIQKINSFVRQLLNQQGLNSVESIDNLEGPLCSFSNKIQKKMDQKDKQQ